MQEKSFVLNKNEYRRRRGVTGKFQLTPLFFIDRMNRKKKVKVKKSRKKIDKKSRVEIWEWEETPEATEAIEKLHETIRKLEAEAPDYGVGK